MTESHDHQILIMDCQWRGGPINKAERTIYYAQQSIIKAACQDDDEKCRIVRDALDRLGKAVRRKDAAVIREADSGLDELAGMIDPDVDNYVD